MADRAFKCVRQRQKGEKQIIVEDLHAPETGCHIGEQIAMRQHHPLGVAGGAGGVDQRCQSVALRAWRGQLVIPALIPGDGVDTLLLTPEGNGGVAASLKLLHLPLFSEHQRHIGIIQYIGDSLRRIGEIGRHRHRSKPQDGKIGDQPLRAVVPKDADAITRLNSSGLQPGRQPQHGLLHTNARTTLPDTAVGLPETEHWPIQPARRGGQQQIGKALRLFRTFQTGAAADRFLIRRIHRAPPCYPARYSLIW